MVSVLIDRDNCYEAKWFFLELKNFLQQCGSVNEFQFDDLLVKENSVQGRQELSSRWLQDSKRCSMLVLKVHEKRTSTIMYI